MRSGLPGRSSQVRHRNALTEKAREDTRTGNRQPKFCEVLKVPRRSEPAGQFVTIFAGSFGNA